ncbi:transketolase [Cellulomonas phragmiteti]|uniref:Transketolase n=1 Tax=Cellulomonas phragmiteti TaxID=478780 RepID=A0ABQ4DR98_9CELL|nr:1-deoxy-D-xylulose-5-phosphate synthase N-terminal domain-containing protein [Cellulomonas phragmiteti]GIG41859.1 transketolase [Cellulomonas phragmiteti]
MPSLRSAAAARRRILGYARGRTVHLGSSLSVVDVLAEVLRRVHAADPGAPRSPVVLSKGHAVWALYALLAEHGHPRYTDAHGLPGHPADGFPGIDVATGSLGHGLSIAAGMAEAFRLDAQERPVYVVLGDGELDEGSVWEAAMFAAHRGLRHLVAVVDVNGLQQEGPTREVLDTSPLDRKWEAFGWRVVPADGHDADDLASALDLAEQADAPAVVLARTVKGKGVPFMEHDLAWHTATLDEARYADAVRGLEP